MPTGHVKWFNNAKGYGFIVMEGSDRDYFAHFSSINMDGFRTLKAGQPVTFEAIETPKGSHAKHRQYQGKTCLCMSKKPQKMGNYHGYQF